MEKISLTIHNLELLKLPIFNFSNFKFHNFKIVHRLCNIFNILDFPYLQSNVLHKCVHSFLIRSNDFGICKSINKGSPGVENPEIMKMLCFSPSLNNADILLDQY